MINKDRLEGYKKLVMEESRAAWRIARSCDLESAPCDVAFWIEPMPSPVKDGTYRCFFQAEFPHNKVHDYDLFLEDLIHYISKTFEGLDGGAPTVDVLETPILSRFLKVYFPAVLSLAAS